MIFVTGSLAFDHIMDFPGNFGDHIMPDKIHQINLSFLVNDLKKQQGGTAGNIAYNLALLKIPVSIVGAAGSDFAEYKKFLQDHGVDTSKIQILKDESTSSAFIMTDMRDNQIAAFYPGAMSKNAELSLMGSPSKSQGSPGRWSPEFVVISPNDPKAMVKFAKEAKEIGIDHMVDPGMQLPALDSEDLKNMVSGATILIGNDYEIALLCDKLALSGVEGLLESVEILITTLGDKGSIIQTKDEKIIVKAARPGQKKIATGPSDPRNDNGVVDPTGAGDAYRAGFLAGYIKGLELKTCGQMGSVAACYTVEKYGTTSHKFTIQEFCERYEQNFGESLHLSS